MLGSLPFGLNGMSVVKPVELTVGPARNQTVIGRVCLLDSSTVSKLGKASDYVELHLVVEDGAVWKSVH